MNAIREFLARLCGPPKVALDIRAFAAAMVGAPIMFAAMGFLLLGYGAIVTSIAAAMSLPGFVLVGGPVACLTITRFPRKDGTASTGLLVIAAFVALGLILPATTLFQLASGLPWEEATNAAGQYAIAGLVTAPIEALCFGYLYGVVASAPQPPKLIQSFR